MYTLNFHLARYQLQHCDISLNTDTLTSLPVVFSGLKQVRDLGSDQPHRHLLLMEHKNLSSKVLPNSCTQLSLTIFMNPFIRAANILFSSSSVSALEKNLEYCLSYFSIKVQITHNIL